MVKSYAISGGHEKTVEVAELILKDGGNAFDAAIAAHLAMYITEPCMASAGAGGFALCYKQGESIKMLDFFTQTPRHKPILVKRDFESIRVNFGNEVEEFHVGMASIATPGSVAGIFELYERYASMPFRVLVEPAKDLIRSGVILNTFQSIDMALLESILRRDESVRSVFFNNDKLIQEGDILKMPYLMDFIDLIKDDGRNGFYKGEIADTINRHSIERGGYIRKEDLENYKAIWRDPLFINYREHNIVLPNGPSLGGGIMALLFHQQLLNKGDWLRSIKAFKDKSLSLLEIEKAVNNEYVNANYSLNSQHSANKGTSHFNILDGHGNAIAFTCTIGEGCGYFIPGTHMQLNNMLGEAFLLPEGFHNWTEDVRLNSMMTPTMVLNKENQLSLICGSGGAGRIPYMIAQMIDSVCVHKLNLAEAMRHSRVYIHHGTVHYETGYSSNINCGLPTQEWKDKSLFFGGVHCISVDGKSSDALGDPRRYGASAKA